MNTGLKINLGLLGEDFVADWLAQQGYEILGRRWRCRWGELDVIAVCHSKLELAFVEVKTRRANSWDEGGLFAVTPQKQTKLWHSAEIFLSSHSPLANYACRFDVALVRYQKTANRLSHYTISDKLIQLGQPVLRENYLLTLSNYLESAFSQT